MAILLVRGRGGGQIPFQKTVVNLGIKVEFESILVSFLSFIHFQPEQPTKEDINWMGIEKKVSD